jgi:hypothetical protein
VRADRSANFYARVVISAVPQPCGRNPEWRAAYAATMATLNIPLEFPD